MKLELVKGDITVENVEAIVNAANSSLLGGGGVDGAIHRKGGSAILEECRMIRARQGKCETGEAVITTAGNLPAQYVIHTVGPVWNGGQKDEYQKLRNCYFNVLKICVNENIRTVSFPNISCGIYRFPKELAAMVALETVQSFPKKNEIDLVRFVCFDDENHEIYRNKMASIGDLI